jgi:hypothetical protein
MNMHRLFLIVALILPTLTFADEGTPLIGPEQTSNRVQGYLWNDANCDGIRAEQEGPMTDNPIGYQAMSLFYVGNDGTPFTSDDSEVATTGTTNGFPTYSFRNGGGGNSYYIAIRPSQRPTGFMPTRWQQGNDPERDNDLMIWPDGAWATEAFVIAGQLVTGIDIGLCPLSAIERPYAASLPLVIR